MTESSSAGRSPAARVLGALGLGLILLLAWRFVAEPEFVPSMDPERPGRASAGKPVRICSVTLATDELLADLVPRDRIAGVTFLVDDPAQSNVVGRYPASIPRVRGNIEQIMAVKPDLVCVASYNLAEFLELLRQCKLPVFRNENIHSFDEVLAGMEALGKRVGEPHRAAVLVADARKRLGDLAKRLAAAPRPRVLYWSGGFTTGKATTIGEIIERAGGANLGAELGIEGEGPIAVERVLAADPDVFLVGVLPGGTAGAGLSKVPALLTLRAVKEGRIVSLEPRLLTTLSLHLVDAAEALARQLHPDCFR